MFAISRVPSFLEIWVSFSCNFLTAWRTSFTISYRAALPATCSLGFHLFEMSFFPLVFEGYFFPGIQFWINFFLSARSRRQSVLFRPPWSLMICRPSFTCTPLYAIFLCLLCFYELQSRFPLPFWSLDYDLPNRPSVFIFLGIQWAFMLCFSPSLGHFQPLVVPNIFSAPVTIPFPSETLVTPVLGWITMSHRFLRPSLVYSILFPPSDGIISIFQAHICWPFCQLYSVVMWIFCFIYRTFQPQNLFPSSLEFLSFFF